MNAPFNNQWTVRLPSSATPFQFALAGVDAARLAALDAELIATLWDPATCPAPLLPFLAWALSVDVWDAGWPEAVKRSVIAASPMVHRRKGTRAAVEDALAAMRMSVRIDEWWQQNPLGRRGTFDVTVFVNAHVFDDELSVLNDRVQRNASAAVRASKPKSRAFDMRLGVEIRGAAAPAVVSQSMQIGKHDTSLRHERVRQVIPAAGAVSQSIQVRRHPASHGHNRVGQSVPAAMAISQSMQVHRGAGRINEATAGLSVPASLALGSQAAVHHGSWRMR